MRTTSLPVIGSGLLVIGTTVGVLGNVLLLAGVYQNRFLRLVELNVGKVAQLLVVGGIVVMWIGWTLAVLIPSRSVT